jgi:hypothetical protein
MQTLAGAGAVMVVVAAAADKTSFETIYTSRFEPIV